MVPIKSANEPLFQGAVSFGPWERIWKPWAPRKCCFFLWPENAVSSSGWWWRITAVGQPIAWHDEVSLILRSAHFVINNQDHPTSSGVMRVCQAILVLPFAESWACCTLPSTLGDFF
jgi:hypothetical protein